MLDGVTLDQLRTFTAAAEQGSFSAAGRKLRRAQSVVSQTLANLEAQLGVQLFDRSEEHTSELQSHSELVCRLLLEKKKKSCIARSCGCISIKGGPTPRCAATTNASTSS